MTDDRSLERAARSLIEAGPTRAPERAVEAALSRIQTTSQERGLRVPWRITMTTPCPRRRGRPDRRARDRRRLVPHREDRPVERRRTRCVTVAPVERAGVECRRDAAIGRPAVPAPGRPGRRARGGDLRRDTVRPGTILHEPAPARMQRIRGRFHSRHVHRPRWLGGFRERRLAGRREQLCARGRSHGVVRGGWLHSDPCHCRTGRGPRRCATRCGGRAERRRFRQCARRSSSPRRDGSRCRDAWRYTGSTSTFSFRRISPGATPATTPGNQGSTPRDRATDGTSGSSMWTASASWSRPWTTPGRRRSARPSSRRSSQSIQRIRAIHGSQPGPPRHAEEAESASRADAID